jgi:ornithine carbamoyltransferase
MSTSLRGRSFLKTQDLARDELRALLDLAADLKRARMAGDERPRLAGKVICLLFEKTSTRTRCSFEVASYHQGAQVTVLDPQSSQMGHKESIADTARVLGRLFDAIEYRGASQTTVEQLARHAGVPVYNGLTDEYHPTQILADLLTMREHGSRPLEQMSFAYVGDARFNMGNSLMIAGCQMGMDVRIAAPRALWPSEPFVAIAREMERREGARLTLTEDAEAAVEGVDFIHTDIWVSMGEPKNVWRERIELLRPYQVNGALMRASGNRDVKFLHCLPAYHDTNTSAGREVADQYGLPDGIEVTDEVFESPANICFDQAENRMHTIKALLVATLAG